MKSFDDNETASAKNRRSVVWITLWLAVVTLAVFWRATECGFINYDDPDYVTKNRYVQQGLTAESIHWAFTVFYANLRTPITWLSHMLDWQMYGANPAGHHLTNVLLHTANTLLLFLLLGRMTGSVWRSAFVAALFALHPLHVETAAWVSERKGVLSLLFWLLTLHGYTQYVRFRAQGLKKQAAGSYAMALVWFACDLMSKPIAVTLPCVLLLLDYWPLERWKHPPVAPAEHPSPETTLGVWTWRRWNWLVWEKMPFVLLSAACSAMVCHAAPGGILTLGQRVGNALVSYLRYLWKTLWPATLAMPYPFPQTWNWPIGLVVLAAVFLVVITCWVIRRMRQQPYLATGWFWFLGTMVPALGLVPMGLYSMADRYSYISLIGIFLVVAWAAGEAMAKRGPWKNVAVFLAVAVLGLCAWRSHYQIGFWTDSGTLFTHTIAVTGPNYYAQNDLGCYYQKKGRLDEAIRHFTEAIKIWPQMDTAWNNLLDTQALKKRQESGHR